ncbi:MAG: RCC1 domain-containing protein [Gemmatimonadota bacterium]
MTADGTAYCWGDNGHSQLGNDSVGGRKLEPVPVLIASGLTFEWIEASWHDFSCAGSAADPYCWGHNDFGQLGRGFVSQQETDLAAPSGGLALSAIEGGISHACAVALDGSAYCWGAGSFGKLGNGARDDGYEPVAVSGDRIFESVTVGNVHSCGLTTDGQALCWGSNEDGQLGIGSNDDSRTTPQPVVGPVGA